MYEFINKIREWCNSIYRIIDSFIGIIPEEIEVCVKGDKGRKENILDKPIVVSAENLTPEDLALVKQYYRIRELEGDGNYEFDEFVKKINSYKYAVLEVKLKDIQYKTIIGFPIKKTPYIYDTPDDKINKASKVCVDGISLSGNPFDYSSVIYDLVRSGTVNFYGNNHPQLSVDRTTILNDDGTKYDAVSKEILRKVIEYAIQEANRHIENNHIERGSELYDRVWQRVFSQIEYASNFFYESLSKGIFDDIIWSNLSAFLENDISIGEFLNKDNVIVNNFDFRRLNDVSKRILQYKLSWASNVEVDENDVNIVFNTSNRKIIPEYEINHFYLKFLICVNNYRKTFDEYDLISNLWPIIPDYLYNLYYGKTLNEHCKISLDKYYNSVYILNNLYVSDHILLSKEFSGNIFTHQQDDYVTTIADILPKYIPVSRPSNTLYVYTIYIAPDKNTSLPNDNINPTYYKAVKEGWSMIAIEEEGKNMEPKIYAKAGKCTRKEMVELLPESFWKERSKYTYMFPNGKKVEDYLSKQ